MKTNQDKMISYNAVMNALDSLRGKKPPENEWEAGYDDAVDQMHDFIECIAKEGIT